MSNNVTSVVLTTLVKLLWRMSREMAKKLKGFGKTLSEGFPYAHDGALPSQSIPTAYPFPERHPWLDRGIPGQFWCRGCCARGKLRDFPIMRRCGLPSGAHPYQILSGRMPIRGNPSFPPDHVAFLRSWASLSINCSW